jgi:amicoumacin kinase
MKLLFTIALRRAEIAMESDIFYERIGSFAGQIHRMSMKYKPVHQRRKHWDSGDALTALKKHTPSDLHAKFDVIANEINALPREQESYGLIHGDLSIGNYLNYEDHPQIIDFDMCEYSWFASDIAIPLFYEIPIPWVVNEQIRKDITKRFYVNFMNGYSKYHNLSNDELRTIPLFINLRQAVVISALYGGRDFNASDWSKWDDEALKFFLNNVRNDIPYIDFDFAAI